MMRSITMQCILLNFSFLLNVFWPRNEHHSFKTALESMNRRHRVTGKGRKLSLYFVVAVHLPGSRGLEISHTVPLR